MCLSASFPTEPKSKDLAVFEKILSVIEQVSLREETSPIAYGRKAFLSIPNSVTPLSHMASSQAGPSTAARYREPPLRMTNFKKTAFRLTTQKTPSRYRG